jgi:hypothetical protein
MCIPFIQLLDLVVSNSIEDPYIVGECCLPHTKFEFVEEIRDKHGIEIELEVGECSRKCVLDGTHQ